MATIAPVNEIILFAKGIFVGFVIAAPVGPVGILCIHRTLHVGLIAGLVAGLGAAFADTIFGAVAAFGLSFVADFFLEYEYELRLFGGILLVGIGIETIIKKTPKSRREDEEAEEEAKDHRWHFYASSFTRTFMLTITNPITILAFGPIFVAANAVVEKGDIIAAWTLIVGVFVGSQLWWMLLCTGTHLGRRHITESHMRWVNRVSGVVIVIFGVLAIASLTPVGKAIFGNNSPPTQQLERSLGVTPDDKPPAAGGTGGSTATGSTGSTGSTGGN